MIGLMIIAGGLFGAAGVALSAMAAHAGGGNLGTAATMLLAHAPALLALGLLPREGSRMLALGGLVLALGVLLFAGDLVMRDWAGTRLFPMAAPAGGIAMIAGWLMVAVAGVAAGRR